MIATFLVLARAEGNHTMLATVLLLAVAAMLIEKTSAYTVNCSEVPQERAAPKSHPYVYNSADYFTHSLKDRQTVYDHSFQMVRNSALGPHHTHAPPRCVQKGLGGN